jgi:hypothetical protein
MRSQLPYSILMIRPVSFGYNKETASSNSFQQIDEQDDQVTTKALAEFDRMVDLLQSHDIRVHVFEDTREPIKPDAQFPNNWISFHHTGEVITYPMMAENRRHERRMDIVDALREVYQVKEIIRFDHHEQTNVYLEGTGSIVFDYAHSIAYACRSPRTDEKLFNEVSHKLGFTPVLFDAVDERGLPIYHTNVMMCVGDKFAVLCLDSIQNDTDQEVLLAKLAETNHQVISISYDQLKAFAGNMIEVKNRSGEPYVLLSETAFNSLLPGQIDAISKHAEMLPISIPTIEKHGGGSVRCMVAGIFLQSV